MAWVKWQEIGVGVGAAIPAEVEGTEEGWYITDCSTKRVDGVASATKVVGSTTGVVSHWCGFFRAASSHR